MSIGTSLDGGTEVDAGGLGGVLVVMIAHGENWHWDEVGVLSGAASRLLGLTRSVGLAGGRVTGTLVVLLLRMRVAMSRSGLGTLLGCTCTRRQSEGSAIGAAFWSLRTFRASFRSVLVVGWASGLAGAVLGQHLDDGNADKLFSLLERCARWLQEILERNRRLADLTLMSERVAVAAKWVDL